MSVWDVQHRERGAIETPSLEDSLNVFSVLREAGAAQLLLCV